MFKNVQANNCIDEPTENNELNLHFPSALAASQPYTTPSSLLSVSPTDLTVKQLKNAQDY